MKSSALYSLVKSFWKALVHSPKVCFYSDSKSNQAGSEDSQSKLCLLIFRQLPHKRQLGVCVWSQGRTVRDENKHRIPAEVLHYDTYQSVITTQILKPKGSKTKVDLGSKEQGQTLQVLPNNNLFLFSSCFTIKKKSVCVWVWWHTPIILAPGDRNVEAATL